VYTVVSTDEADGDCRKRKRVADDAADGERGPSVVSISAFHFSKRRRAQRAVRGHMFRDESGRSRAGDDGINRKQTAAVVKERTAGSRCSRLARGGWSLEEQKGGREGERERKKAGGWCLVGIRCRAHGSVQ
jgi:hypothetical protein